jgi:hypothetical protein
MTSCNPAFNPTVELPLSKKMMMIVKKIPLKTPVKAIILLVVIIVIPLLLTLAMTLRKPHLAQTLHQAAIAVVHHNSWLKLDSINNNNKHSKIALHPRMRMSLSPKKIAAKIRKNQMTQSQFLNLKAYRFTP